MFTAWCDYGATGEGLTIMIAIAHTESAARNLFKSKFNDYFHVGMVVENGIPPAIEPYIPEAIKKYLLQEGGPMCHYQWFGEWHVNCS